jgi:hypothetical protein
LTLQNQTGSYPPKQSRPIRYACALFLPTAHQWSRGLDHCHKRFGYGKRGYCKLIRPQPAVANSSPAASPTCPHLRFEVVFTVMLMAMLNLKNMKGLLIHAEVAKH